MPPITRGYISTLLEPGLHNVFIQVGKERPLEHPSVFNMPPMEWNPITDLEVSGLGTMPEKPEGSQFDYDELLIGSTKAYTAVPFGLAVEVTWESWRDERYGVMRQMIGGMARAARNRKEVDAFYVLNYAFTVADGFDSDYLITTTHTGMDGTNRSNRPSTDVALSQVAIQNGILHFENLEDDRSLPWLMNPSKILIPPEKKFAAREILGTASKPYTANNEINALVEEDLSWQVIHYFTSTTAWFMLAAEHDLNFLILDDTMFNAFDDPMTGNAIFTAYQRHTKGHGAWRGVYGSTG